MRKKRNCLSTNDGFSLIELMTVITLITIVAAISMPSFIEWRKNIEFREAARSIASVLRHARSQAISTNLEQQVAVNCFYKRYGMRAGTQASNNNWAGVDPISDWSTLPQSVSSSSTSTVTVQFIPNGTTSQGIGTIDIQDSAGTTRYQVTVSRSGRISIEKP